MTLNGSPHRNGNGHSKSPALPSSTGDPVLQELRRLRRLVAKLLRRLPPPGTPQTLLIGSLPQLPTWQPPVAPGEALAQAEPVPESHLPTPPAHTLPVAPARPARQLVAPEPDQDMLDIIQAVRSKPLIAKKICAAVDGTWGSRFRDKLAPQALLRREGYIAKVRGGYQATPKGLAALAQRK